jgi:hypothetical protein
MPKSPVTMPKWPVTMRRNAGPVTMTETLGHDAETGGHDAPKYAFGVSLQVRWNGRRECRQALVVLLGQVWQGVGRKFGVCLGAE